MTCEKNPGRVVTRDHCWHALWTPSTYQAGQFDAHEQRCCWCGEVSSLSVGVAFVPIAHGPQEPPALPQQLQPPALPVFWVERSTFIPWRKE